jgi:hypothetical protein
VRGSPCRAPRSPRVVREAATEGPGVPLHHEDPVLGSAQCEIKIAGLCRGSSPARDVVEREEPTPPQSLSDVAQFAPGGAGFVQEPTGWSLPLLPTNVFSTASATTESGELLGWPIEVRFTPVAYTWSFGDGTTRVDSSPGASWGTRQFSVTPTSHRYEISGDYRIGLEVTYEASYRFDGGSLCRCQVRSPIRWSADGRRAQRDPGIGGRGMSFRDPCFGEMLGESPGIVRDC